MNQEARVEELERALRERAQRLAEEYLERGRRSRDHLLADADERLRLREQREILSAKALAARRQRRLVQAGEIRLQGDLDRLRWALIESVLAQTRERLQDLTADTEAYEPVLVRLIRQAIDAIGCRDVVVHLNESDQQRLTPVWESWCKTHFPECQPALAHAPLPAVGGARVECADQSIRVDNTFEGRAERLQDELHRVVLERLFASVTDNGSLING